MKSVGERASVQLLLRAGMGLSVLLFLVGLLLAFAHGGATPVGVPLFSLGALARHGEFAELIAALGVLVLASTPIVRVLLLAWLWAQEKDRRFMWIAITVAAILAFAVVSGRSG
jgi:uncharacterized membrane protein